MDDIILLRVYELKNGKQAIITADLGKEGFLGACVNSDKIEERLLRWNSKGKHLLTEEYDIVEEI